MTTNPGCTGQKRDVATLKAFCFSSALLFVPLMLAPQLVMGDEKVDFSRQIRPILSDKCFACHGPDDTHREGGFRLDEQESAFGEGDSGEFIIVPGNPEKSELMARLVHEDDDLRMPPESTNKSLKTEEIELIRRWIAEGAPWSQHWAFAVPQKRELPKVANASWPRNFIDHYILARLQKEQLSPTEPADKVTLIRRVTFDLTGLPPMVEEVDAFLADESPNAYEKVVDRLLNSPRFGEHMARFWLDAARYGDTHGLHLDNYREMWPYRDWVIRAFNKNKPFDEFIIEQMAGDLLENPTLDQQVASGFNRCNVSTNEGGSIREEVYVRNVVDRVVTNGTVFLGLTLECTRCHDHKYDPLTMKDFYSMFAFFNSIDGNPLDENRKDHAPIVRVPDEGMQEKLEQLARRIATLEKKLSGEWAEIDTLQREWEASIRTTENNLESISAALLGDWYTVGPFPDTQRYLINRKHGPEGQPIDLKQTFDNNGQKLTWKRRGDWVDGKPHADLSHEIAANFLYRTVTVDSPRKIKASFGSDDGIKIYLNDKEILKNDISRAVAPDQEKVDLDLKKGENHLLVKIANYGGVAGFYFSLATKGDSALNKAIAIANVEVGKRSPRQIQELRDYFRNQICDAQLLVDAKKSLEQSRKERADLDRTIPTTLVWKELKQPRKAFVLKRGEYNIKGEEVKRRTPLALPPMAPSLPRNRLGFAKWLVDPGHPLTARVAVNRFWLRVFGTGIVKTAEDFGSQGEPPSHPKLLDALALEFLENDWDTKALMKQLVMSSTYRQSSRLTEELWKKDPENRLLARGPRFRLDAEMLRDQALAVSGLLVNKIGGPGVKPPQPDGLWFAVGYSGSNTVRFRKDAGPDKVHRRTIYTFIKRTAPPPQMSIADAPSREFCSVRRERTNTPLLALMMLNDPQYVEAARALAERAMIAGGETVESRAAYIFRRCAMRKPTAEELDDLVVDYHEHLAAFTRNTDAAKKLVNIGEVSPTDNVNVNELAAWTMVGNLILNLDEVISKN